jgi:hypothetical protein
MKKILIGGTIAIVVIAIAVGAFYLLSNLNSLVADAIETHGSEVTDTSVRVSGVDIALREGRGTITGLSVASPEGFESQVAFSLGDITVDIDLGSVRKDPTVIDEVRIRAPVINAEIKKSGVSNIDELRKRVQAYTAASGESTDGDAKRIRIKTFVFEQGRIEVDATALGVEKRTLTLPEIRMSNVGGTSGGAPDVIAKEVLSVVAKNVASEIANSEINRLIKDQLGESLTDKAKGLLKKITD